LSETSIAELARNLARLHSVKTYEDAELGRDHPGIPGRLRAPANREDDTFAWVDAIDSSLHRVEKERTHKICHAALGKNLMWCWEMTNHQGYLDPVQLELDTVSLDAATIIQIKVVGAALLPPERGRRHLDSARLFS
jgi:hypothetical protein